VLCEPGSETEYEKMAGKIIIDTERCKGCGLCVTVCAKAGIVISKKPNKSGYFPAEPVPSAVEGAANSDSFDKLTTSCTGCAVCALVCPDAAIEIFRDEPNKIKIVTKAGGKAKSRLVKDSSFVVPTTEKEKR
jgi:2-oxoglutarate ferredoxin oxidoreductase subunit delta